MKTSLIILHGALGCREQFNDWKNALSETYNCYSFDFSGHGNRSGETGPFSIKTFSEELKMYIKQNNLERPAIIGYSMGGYVALYTALFTEGFLGDIITIATKFNWTPESSKKEAGYLQPKLMQAKVPQLVMQLEERHGSNWTAVANKTAEMMLQLGENTLLTTENIGRIKNRVKFCVGDKDKMVSIEETYAMYKNVPGASFCVLPGTGHLPEGMSAKRIKFEVEEFILRK